jgi:hypothetical protein
VSPLDAHLCQEWRALTAAAAERAQEIAVLERQLHACKAAQAVLLEQAKALRAYFELGGIYVPGTLGVPPAPETGETPHADH